MTSYESQLWSPAYQVDCTNEEQSENGVENFKREDGARLLWHNTNAENHMWGGNAENHQGKQQPIGKFNCTQLP